MHMCSVQSPFLPLTGLKNIMIWAAPEWSPAAVHFTHGFPRHVIYKEHSSFEPGNIIVTAKATNMSLHHMAFCNLESLVSQISVAGSGLTVSYLVNLR